MLYVKIMSDQNLPDTDPWKHYTIVPVENSQALEFVAKDDGHALLVHTSDGSELVTRLTGNAYVMNEHGRTIASHGC